METQSPARFRFGPYEVRAVTRELFRRGVRVKLPPQAFEVLRVLLEHKGELVTRQEFHHALWPADTFVDFDQGLNNAIKRIRDVLNDSAESPRYIETLPRLGYRFIGELDSLPTPSIVPAVMADSLPPQDPVITTMPAVADPRLDHRIAIRRRSRKSALLVGAATIALLGLAWLLRPRYSRPRITGETQLTTDGIPKSGPLVTDGLRVYFTEVLNGRETVAAVPVNGGQPVPLNLPFAKVGLYDISPSKTDLLVAETSNMYEDAPVWRIPILGGTPRRLGKVAAHDATWSPDGTLLAYTAGGGVYLAKSDGSDPHTIVPPGNDPDEWAWRPIWSHDNRSIRFDRYNMATHGAHEWEVDVDGGHLHPLFGEAAEWLMQAFGSWTPDGNYYLFSSWRDLESSTPFPAADLWALREHGDFLHRPSAAPERLTVGPIRYFVHTSSLDGKTIFALGTHKRGELMRYDVRTRATSLYASGLSAEGVSFSRDGKWVAYIKFPQGELWRTRIDGSESLQLSSRPLFASTPSWSPDGKQIAFNGTRAGEAGYSYLVSAEGGEPRRIDKAAEGSDPNWTPDGSALVFMDDDHDHGFLRMLNVQTGNVTALPDSKTLMAPRVSPDGRWILAVSQNLQKLLLFEVKSQIWRELAQANFLEWPTWSSDSRYIYFARPSPNAEIVRVPVTGGKPEFVVSLKGFKTTGVDSGWFTLTPEGDVLFLRDSGGSTEIYALTWEAP